MAAYAMYAAIAEKGSLGTCGSFIAEAAVRAAAIEESRQLMEKGRTGDLHLAEFHALVVVTAAVFWSLLHTGGGGAGSAGSKAVIPAAAGSGDGGPITFSPNIQRVTKVLMRRIEAYAGVHPPCRPLHLYVQGLRAAVAGSISGALSLFKACAKDATTLNMPFEKALAFQKVGHFQRNAVGMAMTDFALTTFSGIGIQSGLFVEEAKADKGGAV
jgi:hypothetical protein